MQSEQPLVQPQEVIEISPLVVRHTSVFRVGSGSPASQTWWNLDSLRLQAPAKISSPQELSSLIQSVVGQVSYLLWLTI